MGHLLVFPLLLPLGNALLHAMKQKNKSRMTRGIAVGAYANHADPVAPDKDIVAVFSTRIAYIGYTLRSLIAKK